MKRSLIPLSVISLLLLWSFSWVPVNPYQETYLGSLRKLKESERALRTQIAGNDLSDSKTRQQLIGQIHDNRILLKRLDFWLRYFDPLAYMKLNGPLPVEWENEVFEKYEPPYRRTGAGLLLAENYLNEPAPVKDSLLSMIDSSLQAITAFETDSVLQLLNSGDQFYFANRLFLLNLAALYTTGFECPDTARVIPELRDMMQSVSLIYAHFQRAFPADSLPAEYLSLYRRCLEFVQASSPGFSEFDHFAFIRDFVNPLFSMNQAIIRARGGWSANYNDYSLNNQASSIFSKSLFSAQNSKGAFSLVEDSAVLGEIREMGRLLFYDPLLSGNNQRSCASCHRPAEYFTDTLPRTPLQFDRKHFLPRNAPSLLNVTYNHLLMLDGRHYSLQDQARDVISNPVEMNGRPDQVVEKLMSCRQYRRAFRKFLKYTPEEKEVNMEHIVSALTYYYAGFSGFNAPFDDAMNGRSGLPAAARRGFNLFMGRAQCGTCHFVPLFNGVKPPYISSEFEVLGVPADAGYSKLSADSGRYKMNPAPEMLFAFRTNSLRNISHTAPYMHNGVFRTLEQVLEFYDAGGGVGHGLTISGQTLSEDSLHLSDGDKRDLLAFLQTLNERIKFELPPAQLPVSDRDDLNKRKPGGEY